ncbi:ABC transporter permease [Metaclostridioides mangenotii]|uniref:ABC-type antimicrobial peptide transport system permease subunit n=1 Tax=Metaclostridioides mangenotii TaxID=1540 RepID=A0ABS4EB98_9FIRM|nr:FtsX-like permease family protein [Clostridioides mangenotii]MBP1855208.1 ABC-type antimicrobial peptide transport system permease subunit [Clostridioides mangenotii]
MKNDLNLVFKYIKSYKARSIAIILSIVMGTALIVGVGTLARSAQQADLDLMKRELGIYHVRYKDINSDQLKLIIQNEEIKSIGIESYYASTDVGEKIPINFVYADQNYLKSDSKIVKGRFPQKDHEVVVEAWILNSMGLEPKLNQEITFKLYEKKKTETFKIVGILQDRYKDKSVGRCEMFLSLDTYKGNKIGANVEFKEGSEIRKNIDDLSNMIMVDKKDNVGINGMLVDSVSNNGAIDNESRNTAISVSIFAAFVIYSIYSISVYQRIRDYGMLRAIGATNTRIFKMMLYELLLLSSFAMPIGILIGMAGAQIFNKLSGNVQFYGALKTTPFIIPINVIILSVGCTLLLVFMISLFTFMKIRRISPVEAIRRNFGSNKNIKISKLVTIIGRNLDITKSISFKNIFRNKVGFIIIILSMSIGGLMIIKTDYAFSRGDKMKEVSNMETFMNGDFVLSANGAIDQNSGIDASQVKKIEEIKGISEVKAAKIFYTRMVANKKDILEPNYFKNREKGMYTKKVLDGLLMNDKDSDNILIKQKLKGFNTSMLNSLSKYLVEGKIDVNKMKNNNTAIVYNPYVVEPYKGRSDVVNHNTGKPLMDIKIGDTIKVKMPKGKADPEVYWKGQDNYEYEEFEFTVGGIVDYPYADDNLYTSESVDVIVSDNYLSSLTDVNNYSIIYANMDKGADRKSINTQLGKISGKQTGVLTIDIAKDKENSQKMALKSKIYNYGIVAVIFVISMFNIINSISYSLTSRTSEFGMLRAVGLEENNFKNMITYEGILYGIISSLVVTVLGLIMQLRMYKTYGFEQYGMEFAINYKIYLILIALNVIIGLLATYIPARKIKKVDIVESINIVE